MAFHRGAGLQLRGEVMASKNQQWVIVGVVVCVVGFIVYKLFGNTKSVHAAPAGGQAYGPVGGYGGGAYAPVDYQPTNGLNNLLNSLASLFKGGGGGGGSRPSSGSGSGSGSGFGSGSSSGGFGSDGETLSEFKFLAETPPTDDVNAENAAVLGGFQFSDSQIQSFYEPTNGTLDNLPTYSVDTSSAYSVDSSSADSTAYQIPYADTNGTLDLSSDAYSVPGASSDSTDASAYDYGGGGGGGGGYDNIVNVEDYASTD